MNVSINQRRERLLVTSFAADPRASRPRPLRPAPAPVASLAGVPEGLRSRIGTGLHSTAFPYPQFLESDGSLVEREVDIISLQNRRWLVELSPSLGGRILRIHDRHRDRELLLQPAVLRLGVIGLPGAWFVGGIEFNAFRYGHNVHGLAGIGARRVRLADGRPAVRMGAWDELFGTEWSVTVALGKAQVLLRMELHNASASVQPDYWWTTIAVPAQPHTRVLAQPGPVLHHGMFRTGYQHDVWPGLHAGDGATDWSRWLEHHEIASAYWYRNGGDFFGYAEAGSGFAFVHQADHRICRGRKLWTLGAGRDNGIWCDRLLEPASPSYLELQSGLHPLQVEAGDLRPGERRAWTESIGSCDFAFDEGSASYPELFRRYEEAAARALVSEYRKHQEAALWDVTEETELSAPAARLALSRRIVQAPETIAAAEVRAVCAEGWVAGPAWIARLEQLEANEELDNWGRLALAVARIDAGTAERAWPVLRALAAGCDAPAGWAALYLGLPACDASWLEQAVSLLPEQADGWLALDAALTATGRHLERGNLWARAPERVRNLDAARVARAAGALARGDWPEARNLLDAPLPTIAEGSPTPWLIFRETYFAEAAAQVRAGREHEASRALIEAGQPAPQFGVGRDEAGWGGDLLYYRWRLAQRAKRSLEASLWLAQALRLRPYAGSVSAAYLARLALEAGHHEGRLRRDEVLEWDRAGGAAALAFSPLRAVVVAAMGGPRGDLWSALRQDPLYRHRAELEEQLRAE